MFSGVETARNWGRWRSIWKRGGADPDCVRLQAELDDVTETNLPVHVDGLHPSPEQTWTLAAVRETYAARVEPNVHAADTVYCDSLPVIAVPSERSPVKRYNDPYE